MMNHKMMEKTEIMLLLYINTYHTGVNPARDKHDRYHRPQDNHKYPGSQKTRT
jgi:hypothetical protein